MCVVDWLTIGRIDIWGNDRYLRHVHRESLNQIRPEATHEVVLGDLFGSQWIKDEEFVDRVRRYNDIIFQDVTPFNPLIVEIARDTIWSRSIYEYHGKP
jgi:hypothetical protein